MNIQALGHVVIKVRNLERSEAFYNGLLGMSICARNEKPTMTFFSMGNHHDFAIAAVGDDAERASKNSVGLAHVAFKIGDDMSELMEAKKLLDDAEAGEERYPVTPPQRPRRRVVGDQASVDRLAGEVEEDEERGKHDQRQPAGESDKQQERQHDQREWHGNPLEPVAL